MSAQEIIETPILDYQSISKPECIFAAVWHNPEGTVTTEAIAQYYQVPVEYILDTLNLHHEEIGATEKWTPRAAIRIGLLLTSPIATAVRSLAMDVIEAYKQPSKKASIKYLLENTQFVEWSNREIGRILECSHKAVGKARKELEDSGNILPFKRRKHIRAGTEVERESQNPSPLMGTSPHEQHSNPDSSVVKVRVSSQSHDRFEQEGVIVKQREGHWQKLVRFDDGEEVAITDTEIEILNAPSVQAEVESLPVETVPSERRYPALYEEAIAQLKLQHQKEMEQLEQQLRAGLETEAEARAIERVREHLIASQALASDKALECAKLQQTVEELQSLRLLEVENQQLQQRIEELNRALEKRPVQEWGNTLTVQAEKAINIHTIKTIKAMEPDLHLRSLATSPPTNVETCLELMGMAIANLGKALNSTSALSYAAAMLRCAPTPEAIAMQSERNLMAYQAVKDIRKAIEQGCSWGELKTKADEYAQIKQDYWALLTLDERSLINKLKKDFDSGRDLTVKAQSRVTHADQFNKLSQTQGTVLSVENGKFIVHWDNCDRPLFQHRYEEKELILVD